MAPEKNIPDNQSKAAILQKQVMEVTAQLQDEIKRLSEHPDESSGNAELYHSLADLTLKIKEEAFHPDVITALEISVEKLEHSEQQAKDHRPNRDILPNLLLTNSELARAKNIKG